MIELLLGAFALWVVLTAIASWGSAFIYWLIAPTQWFIGLAPSLRSFSLLVFVLSAPMAALMAIFLVSRPMLSHLFVPPHCHGNDCSSHAPVYAEGSLLMVGLAGVISFAALAVIFIFISSLLKGARQLKHVMFFSEHTEKGWRTLDSAGLLVWCAGLWRPQIVLSRGLVERLSDEELDIVLAHEQAHVRRFDNLRKLFLFWATLFWPGFIKRPFRSGAQIDAEKACDWSATQIAGSKEPVVALIKKVVGLCSSAPSHRSGPSPDNQVSERILALESGQESAYSLQAQFICFGLVLVNYCMLIYLLVNICHPLVEWLGTL